MSSVLRLAVVCVLAVVAAGLSPLAASAADPRQQAFDRAFGDFQATFDRFFGLQGEEVEQALAEIHVSIQEERRMGQAAVDAYLDRLRSQQIRVVSRGREVTYLRDLVATIRPWLQQKKRYRSLQVYFAESLQCDARSFPGGTLIFFRGLLDFAESEAALIGIVGHELSHLDRGHHLRRVRRVKLAEQTFRGSGKGQFDAQRFFTAGATLARVWMRPFRPEDEAAADQDGARWAYLADYDAREMAGLFRDLHKRHGGGQFPVPTFMRTHPAALDRQRAIMQLYDQLQAQTPKNRVYVGKENLRRRVARLRQEHQEWAPAR